MSQPPQRPRRYILQYQINLPCLLQPLSPPSSPQPPPSSPSHPQSPPPNPRPPSMRTSSSSSVPDHLHGPHRSVHPVLRPRLPRHSPTPPSHRLHHLSTCSLHQVLGLRISAPASSLLGESCQPLTPAWYPVPPMAVRPDRRELAPLAWPVPPGSLPHHWGRAHSRRGRPRTPGPL